MFVALAVSACSDDGASDDASSDAETRADTGADIADDTDAANGSDAGDGDQSDGSALPAFTQRNCDPLQPARCELPWPSNQFLKPDPSRATGYTLSFGDETLPAVDSGAFAGTQAHPEPWRRLDGYGPSTPLMVLFPGIDTANLAGESTIETSLDDDAPIVWLEVDDDGHAVRRIPYFVELDERADTDQKRVLYVRPAEILKEQTRYVVGFRNLRDTDGAPIEASPAFQKLVSGQTASEPALTERQDKFDDIFSILDQQGVQPDNLTLAWDFVTGSNEALHGSMLHMRDRGFEITGEKGPELTITHVEENAEDDDKWWLEIEGTFESPRFMKTVDIEGQSGWVFNRGEDGRPVQNGTHTQDFWLYVPQSARDGSPHGLIEYGHGLLGTGEQTHGGFNREIANTHKFIFFGTSLAGMSEEDAGSAVLALSNINAFPFMADRLHQGVLEYLLLARSMRERLADQEAISSRGISVDSDQLFYSGISQGGIFGATYIALSTDTSYAHLGVPGNNYSTLLRRSVDFDGYFGIMSTAYTNPVSQAVALLAMQLLWDQTDPVTYLRHITADPFAGNDPHYALFAPAKGDHQVAPLTDEIAARSDIGIKLMKNYGREVDLVEPHDYPYTGSGIVSYDFGNPWPAPGNHPPQSDMDDPHGEPRKRAWHNEQMVHFFRNDAEIIDVCGGDGCTPD